MPSTYSPDLRIELIANGEKTGTWGTITNTNLGTLLEDAIAGLADVIVTTSAQALTVLDGAADQARCAAVRVTTTTTADFSVFVPPVTKLYAFINDSSYVATVYCSTIAGNTTAAGLGIAVPANSAVLLRSNGLNVSEQVNHIAGDLTVGGTLVVEGSFSPPGGVLSPAEGGTGVTTLTGVAFGNGTSAFTAATAAQIVAAIGATAVANATNATSATSATTATTATSAAAITNTGGWSVTPTGTKLYFNYNGVNVGSLSSAGNFIVTGNVTAFGTP